MHLLADLLIAFANVGVALAVVPALVVGYQKKICSIPLTTSVGRIVFLSLMVVGFGLDGLWSATFCTLGNITIWTILATQNRMYAHNTINHKEAAG